MEVIPIEQIIELQISKEQFEIKEKLLTVASFISLFFSVAIIMIEAIQWFEVNLIDYWLNILLLILPPIIFAINKLIYILPIFPYFFSKKYKFPGIDYSYIVKEQTKPTTLKYKVRKVFLIGFCILGVLTNIGNVVLFIIEIII